MSEKRWALVGKAVAMIIGFYLALWMSVALAGTVSQIVGDADNTFIECRAVKNIRTVFPPIQIVEGKPIEYCEQWAKEHP